MLVTGIKEIGDYYVATMKRLKIRCLFSFDDIWHW
jgi:hypothetical protein